MITDLIQFILAMIGSLWACVYILNLNEVGGLNNLINNPLVVDKLNFFPDVNDKETFLTILIIPLAVQWWAVWYPGAEPGGEVTLHRGCYLPKMKKVLYIQLFFLMLLIMLSGHGHGYL